MDRRYKRPKNGLLGGLSIFLIIAVLATSTGYLFTKHIVYPYFLGEELPESFKVKEAKTNGNEERVVSQDIKDSQKETTVENEAENKEEKEPAITPVRSETLNLYTIQYGSFGTEAAAKESVMALKAAGINGLMFKKDGMYKVVEEPYSDEERVRMKLSERKEKFGEEIFITKMEAWLQ